MPRITPVHWKALECVFVKAGFVFKRQVGSHRSYERKGTLRPVIIPTYKEIGLDIIKSNMRTANMSKEDYLGFLEECK
jgi:predicted RNA binding protein YcfA (HicA-like mRNA interferase family)